MVWEWFDPQKKDFWEVMAHIAAVAGGLLAAFKGLNELRENRRQRQRELAWSQANALRELIEGIYADTKSRDALLMLDYSKRNYEIAPGERVAITKDDVEAALRTRDLKFLAPQAYARDCFDTLFRKLEDIEQALEIDLVRADHVSQSLAYFLRLLAKRKRALNEFLERYDYSAVLRLLRRSAEWEDAKENADL
jgi:hypothetical protein